MGDEKEILLVLHFKPGKMEELQDLALGSTWGLNEACYQSRAF